MPYPMARPDDPVHLKNFDPKTFYPAVAIRGDSLDTSIYPSSSISQTETQAHHAGTDQPRPALRHTYVLYYYAGPSVVLCGRKRNNMLTSGTASLGCGNSNNATGYGYG